MKFSSLRLASPLALALLSVPARAVDAFNNLDPSPNAYQGLTGRIVGVGSPYADLGQGVGFTATASGVVSGLSIAMNNYQSDLGAHREYTLRLHASNAQGRVGTLLGTYTGLSTGKLSFGTTDALSEVGAGSTSVALTSGAKYWLLAFGVGNASLAWNVSNRTNSMDLVAVPNNDPVYMSSTFSPAFAVRVSPVPEPASVAALGLGVAAATRRRRRA